MRAVMVALTKVITIGIENSKFIKERLNGNIIFRENTLKREFSASGNQLNIR